MNSHDEEREGAGKDVKNPNENYSDRVAAAIRETEEALRRSRLRYQLLVEQTIEYAMLTMDTAGIIESWNKGAERIFGYHEADVVGKSAALIFTPEDRRAGAFKMELTTAQENGQASDERWHLRRDNSRFWGSGVVTALWDGDSLTGYAKVMRDNTRRKQNEADLQASEARLAREVAALERMNQMTEQVVAAADLQAALDEILNASVEILGADFGLVQLLHPENHTLEIMAHRGFEQPFLDAFQTINANETNAVGRALATGRRVVIENVAQDEAYAPYWKAAEEAGYQAVQSTPLINYEGEMLGALSTYYRRPISLTDREKRLLGLLGRHAAVLLQQLNTEKALEQRVRERTEQVRRLASELINAEQRERERIAQTLHDDLQQWLYAAQVQLQFLQKNMKESPGLAADAGTYVEEAAEIEKIVSESVRLTRDLTAELNPPLPHGAGLLLTFDWLAEHISNMHGLQVTVEGDDVSEELTRNQKLLLFQIVRELLFNVVKHADANHAAISIQKRADGVEVTVGDKGRGFDVAAVMAQEKAGFGLRSIDERLKLFASGIEIDSAPGQGTRITLFMPFVK